MAKHIAHWISPCAHRKQITEHKAVSYGMLSTAMLPHLVFTNYTTRCDVIVMKCIWYFELNLYVSHFYIVNTNRIMPFYNYLCNERHTYVIFMFSDCCLIVMVTAVTDL